MICNYRLGLVSLMYRGNAPKRKRVPMSSVALFLVLDGTCYGIRSGFANTTEAEAGRLTWLQELKANGASESVQVVIG